MLSMAMYLDDNGHTQHASLTEYSDLDQINNHLLLFRSGLSMSNVRSLEHAIKLKTVYERIRKEEPDLHYQLVAIKAMKEVGPEPKG